MLDRIEAVGSPSGKPSQAVVVVGCGELTPPSKRPAGREAGGGARADATGAAEAGAADASAAAGTSGVVVEKQPAAKKAKPSE